MRVLAALSLLCLSLSVSADVSAIYGKFSPTGLVTDVRPTLSWKVTPTGGGKVSAVDLVVNRLPVSGTYNSTSGAVEYTPELPLIAGLYTVECRVTISQQVIVRQDWTFEVGTSGDRDASTGYGATLGFDTLNLLRAGMNQPGFVLDGRLSAAAAAHSKYQLLNREVGHYEQAGKPGFTGSAPWDRARVFGYPGTCYEDACGGQLDPRKSVRMLFDAPYHRIPFLQPGSPAVGLGFESGYTTIKFGVTSEEGVGMSPASGQTGIPTAWDGNESPSPLRIHGARGPVGYPVVFGWFSARMEGIRVNTMTLTGPDGREVPCYLNTPANDPELRFVAFLMPRQPLAKNATYTVQVKAMTNRDVRLDRQWTFTTEP